MAHNVGDLVKVSGTLTDVAGATLDPTVVYIEYIDPSGNATILTYGTDAALVKDSVGVYHADIDADESGTWYYRFYSTGTGQGSEEKTFKVKRSRFGAAVISPSVEIAATVGTLTLAGESAAIFAVAPDNVTISATVGTITLDGPAATVVDASAITLVFYEDHETNNPTPLYGRLSQWYLGGPSPDDDSGSFSRPTDGAVTSQAHSGSYAMRTNIAVTASTTSGCRTNYRELLESDQLGEYYYGAWYYVPTRITVGNFWQNMQFKVRNTALGTAPYVAFGLYMINPGVGQMSYRLSYKLGEDASIPGPFEGGGLTAYSEDSGVLVPEATWYHVEAFLKPSVYPAYNGRITIRLNGVEIFDWNNIVTLDQSADRYNVWHITNYGRNLKNGSTIGDGSATVVLYNDDETIGQNGWIYGSAVEPW